MEKAKYKPQGSAWIDITVNSNTLEDLIVIHEVKSPHALLMKYWKEFKLKQDNFDRIRIKIKK